MTLTREQIVDKLIEGKPISIVRAGDGEGIVLNSMSSVKAMQFCDQAVMQRQLGFSPSLKDMEEIRNNLIKAYAGADIIGIPQHKQKTDNNWARVMQYLKESVPVRTEDVCSIDVAYEMLADGSYDRLLQNRKVLNYISCRDLDAGFHQKWNIAIVNKYTISPEKKFTSGYEGEPHWPTQFNKAHRWLEVMAERHPGSLLLIGAGVVGKLYCNWWRDLGGVAMDIGGVMDIWFGKVTRGADKGLDKDDPDPKYKIV